MPRPIAARHAPAAPALAALALAALAAGCAEDAPRCPGRGEGAFVLQATRTAVACAAGAPADGFDGAYPPAFTIPVTVAFAAEGTGAAVCTLRRTSDPLTGTHQGDQVTVALETGGAVLAACAPGCAVTVRQELTGTLLRDPGTGQATGLTGTLVDRATAADPAACAPCTPPCQATYALAPAPAAP